MKQLEQKEFSTFLIEYHNHGYRSLKPLMLWIDDNEVYHNIESELRKLCYCKAVHPVRGHDYAGKNGEYENAKGLYYSTSAPIIFRYDLEYGIYQSRNLQIPYICLMHTDPLGISNDDSDEINKIAPIDEDCRLFLEENFENYSIK